MSHIYNLYDLSYNTEKLYNESLSLNYDKPIDYDKDPLNGSWLKTRITEDQIHANELKMFFEDLLGVKVSPLYYKQIAGERVVKHIDTLCSCSINIVLNGNRSPVLFHDDGNTFAYVYRCALLNVSGYYHEVPASETERSILRFAVSVNTNYEETMNKLVEGIMNVSS